MKIKNKQTSKFLLLGNPMPSWVDNIGEASCLTIEQAENILYVEQEEAAMGGEPCHIEIIDEGLRPCQCGSGEPWASCWAESQYCG